VERVLANIDASYGDCGVEFRRHKVLHVFGAPCQRNSLAGQEHGRTIPLPELGGKIRPPTAVIAKPVPWTRGFT
jgi:hypothetical protein